MTSSTLGTTATTRQDGRVCPVPLVCPAMPVRPRGGWCAPRGRRGPVCPVPTAPHVSPLTRRMPANRFVFSGFSLAYSMHPYFL